MIEVCDEAGLAAAIKSADGPVSVRGGGTRMVAVPGRVLSTSGVTGITLYEPGALTLSARAGTRLAEVEAALAAKGQRLPFEPPDMRGLLGTQGTPTIGGMVAANASGPRRVQAGACRDALIGVRFVDGAGTVIKNGGRVMKNVTGYDLVKLMAGSFGTLGVLSEVTFKVLPKPPARAVCLIEGLSPERAVSAMASALGSPYEVNGAAHTMAGIDGDPATIIRVEGFEGSVAHRSQALADRLAEFGDVAIETDPDRTRAGWAWARDVEAFHGVEGDVWRLSVKPSDAPGVIDRLDARGLLMDWGGGLIWALTDEGSNARAALESVGGHATLVRAGAETRERLGRFHPETGPLAMISKGLRAKFDPRGILNAGLMG